MSDNPERLNADMVSEHLVKMAQFLTTAVELAGKDPEKLDDAADYAQSVTDSLRSFAELLRAWAREERKLKSRGCNPVAIHDLLPRESLANSCKDGWPSG